MEKERAGGVQENKLVLARILGLGVIGYCWLGNSTPPLRAPPNLLLTERNFLHLRRATSKGYLPLKLLQLLHLDFF